uniref:Cadherin domain-containing protein n=1 Tax=Heterorhabditis bacteriophora TaxID=37862 RepID=A0A1I7XQH8_HETBA
MAIRISAVLPNIISDLVIDYVVNEILANSIYAPTDTLIVHANAREGDEIVSDQPFRIAIDEDEDVALSFEPASDLISVFPAIVSPGRVIHFIITNPKLLIERVKENYKLQGLGLISGNLHEVPIRLEMHRSSSESNNRVPSFEQEVYLLKLEDNFKEKEIAILKLTKSPPKDVWFQLIGPFAERFTVSNQHENVYITTLVCDQPCFIPDQITILVVASDGQSDSRTTVTFSLKSEDNISFLQNDYEAIVEEKTGHFKKAVKIEATGADHLIYSLQDETGLFVLHKSGILMVQEDLKYNANRRIHPEFLTQENYGEQINVTAIASDGKRTITKDIKVKIIPKQKYHYNFKFMKDSYYFVVHPGEKFVGLIAAENSRNESLEYRISEGGQGQFTIDKSGSLFFGGIAMRDTRNYTLQVIAQSHSSHFFVISTKVNVSIEGIHSYPLRVDGVVTTSSKIDSGSNVGTVISTWEFIDDDDDAKLLLSVEHVKALDMNGNEYTEKEVLENLISTEIRGKEGKLLLNKRIEDLPITVLSVAAKAEDTAHTRESPIIGDFDN